VTRWRASATTAAWRPVRSISAPIPRRSAATATAPAILVEYTKGGKDYDMRVLARVSFDPDFGL
jgi:hypothetical protein